MRFENLWPTPRGLTLRRNAVSYWHRGWAWLIGPLLVGLVAVGLAYSSEEATRLNRWLWTGRPLVPFLLLPSAFAALSWICLRYFPGAQGSGIPQAIAAMKGEDRVPPRALLSVRIMVGKVLMTVGGLAAGAAIGREGPTVQIGASIMHAFYGRGPLQGEQQRRTLILAGGAAGIAAAFNTPLAGIMFAIADGAADIQAISSRFSKSYTPFKLYAMANCLDNSWRMSSPRTLPPPRLSCNCSTAKRKTSSYALGSRCVLQ
jgi:H+/Cl- antiporter ClcA